MQKKNLYASEVYENCLNRIEQLTPETRPQWGSMTAAQMLAHCSEIQEVTNGKELKNTPFIAKLFRGMIRNMIVNEKPYPRALKLIRSIYKPRIVILPMRKSACWMHWHNLQLAKKNLKQRNIRFLAKWRLRKKAGACTSTSTIIWPSLVFRGNR